MTASTPSVIIVGSGPAGYTAAIYAARANLNPVLIEGSVTAGGALMNTTEVENYPGFRDGITGPELMDELRAQAERFGTTFVTDDAIDFDLEGSTKNITTADGETHSAPAVILATGSQYRNLGLPHEQRLSGRGVSWCATCDGFFFRGKTVAVVGGGDTALEEATFLTKFADKVYVIHRRDTLRASKAMQDRAFANPKIRFVYDHEVTELHGGTNLEGVTTQSTKNGHQTYLELDGLFVAIGHDPRSAAFSDHITTDSEGYVVVTQPTTVTNIDGVFACGDLVDNIYRQAITAAASGCRAALDTERFLADKGHTA